MFNNGRAGVVTNTTVERRSGPPRTVASIMKLDQYVVTFYDETGDEHQDVFVRIGDRFYASPFGEDWCRKLRGVVSWLNTEVKNRIDAKERGTSPAAIPSEDAVDVTGSKLTKKVEGEH